MFHLIRKLSNEVIQWFQGFLKTKKKMDKYIHNVGNDGKQRVENTILYIILHKRYKTEVFEF